MKTVLIILTKNDQSNLNCNESISALMLFASFGINIHVLFRDAGLSLISSNTPIHIQLNQFLKPAKKMVDSFEFYDIDHLYILEQDQQHFLVQSSNHDLKFVMLNQDFLQQFDHIITW